ncbi:response regulator transcription factor [Kovacikia minuta CCNUW1]|uniref:response regulator transcription factor n=1 Tax=Kovacikia minuta TaxID=2931930 RepID=UPI001CCA9276|nr:response regulator transcription factor [Kovacikia minuta]UBF24914.1 response regulator transcription factor [Kovacikia minuta CCNUW1]
MSNIPETNRPPSRGIRLMVIEDDPVFRLGLITALEEFPDLRVVFEADSGVAALRILQDWMGKPSDTGSNPPTQAIAPEVVILSLDLGKSRTGDNAGLILCQQLRARYPELPLLLLSARQEPLELAMALQTGAGGFCPKGAEISQLVTAIRLVARGQSYWNPAIRTITQALATPEPASFASAGARSAAFPIVSRSTPGKELVNPPSPTESGSFAVLKRNLRRSGLQQIDAAIALLNNQLQNPDLSVLDQLFLTGRRRELRAARWLVNQVLTSSRERLGTNRGQNGEARSQEPGVRSEISPQSPVLSPQSPVSSPPPSPPSPLSPPLPPPSAPLLLPAFAPSEPPYLMLRLASSSPVCGI